MTASHSDTGPVRVDKWLWAARFYKTRALAAAAVAGGKVKRNGERMKPSHVLRVNDALTLHIGPYEYDIRVLGLSTRRGPAALAASLYIESESSQAARRTLASQLAAERRAQIHTDRRPSKQERRQILQFKKSRGG